MSITYKELNEKSDHAAYLLKEKGVLADEIIGIMVEPSVEMVIGLLAILKAGGAYLPIDPQYPEERIDYMLTDSAAKILLKSDAINRVPTPHHLSFNLSTLSSSSTLTCQVSPANLASIIYTSGTSGEPKGVLIHHRGLVNYTLWRVAFYRLTPYDRTLQLLSYCFDGFASNFYSSLLSGGTLFMVPGSKRLDFDYIRSLIKCCHITNISLVPSMYRMLLQSVEPGDLDSLKFIVLAGETTNEELIEKSKANAPHISLFNEYGPTEATVTAAGGTRICASKVGMIGKPITNTCIYILDTYLNPVPLGVVGELCIAGTGVARGYLNNPELTAKKFDHDLWDYRDYHDGYHKSYRSYRSYIYRTGDLARWLPEGDIEFLGRIDNQVKIRGFRVELGEIQLQLLKHDLTREAVVIDRQEENGTAYLCAYIVPKETFDLKVLKEYLSKHLPNYMIPSYFVQLDRIPLNPNGKLDRKSLPEPQLDRGEDYTAPRNEIEKKLAVLWQEVLGPGKDTRYESPGISIDADFFALGGHSVKVLQLINLIHKEFNMKVNFQDIYQSSTIASLSRLLGKNEPGHHMKIPIQPNKNYYELSYSQERLWLLYQMDPGDTSFHTGGRITLNEQVDKNIIKKVFERLVHRHEAFRTCFKKIEDRPVQVIHPVGQMVLDVVDLSHLEENEQEKRKNKLFHDENQMPFDLEKGPLFRTKLIKYEDSKFDVLVTMHHIICDGWSIEVLEKEFYSIYESHKKSNPDGLPRLPIRYRDYVSWHNDLLRDEKKMRTAREFWKSQLANVPSFLQLPYDYAKKHQANKESAGFRLVVPGEILEPLRQITREQKVSLFMLLVAGFNLFLSRTTGQQDIVIGVPAAARQHEDLKHVIGFFVNTLMLRNRVNPDQSFNQFLEKIQNNTFRVLEYQSYPLELICSELKIKYPDISVFFNMTALGNRNQEPLEDFESYHVEHVQPAKFDMVCYLAEYKNAVVIDTHYYKQLFKTEKIEKLLRLYLKILKDISQNPGKKVKEYVMAERRLKVKLN
jgi:amino acid adenylation domain-containing protein